MRPDPIDEWRSLPPLMQQLVTESLDTVIRNARIHLDADEPIDVDGVKLSTGATLDAFKVAINVLNALAGQG